MTKSLAVLLTVFNRKDTTLNCLRNLSRQNIPEGVSYDVWLTDDGCTDGTPEAVSKEFPEVHIINGDGTLFWNRGMWTAWDAASKYKDYDYYLWLNDDTNLYATALNDLLLASEQKENNCVVVGPCQFEDHHAVSYGGFIKGKVVTPNGELQEVETFNGNIVLVPRNVFHQVGNLDYYYRHNRGDTDYGRRVKKAGLKSYTLGVIIGECNRHEALRNCWNPDIPLRKRLKDLYKPTNYPPNELWHSEVKYKGYISACFHMVTLYLRVLFPQIWVWLGKARI